MAAIFLMTKSASAWLLHEHTLIAHAAFQKLTPHELAVLQQAWALAKDPLFCSQLDYGPDGFRAEPDATQCLGFSALTGVAGDHSCSPEDLDATLQSDFVMDVLEEAEKVRVDLLLARVNNDQEGQATAWKQHHVSMLVADPDYLRRAESNAAHFQSPRVAGETLEEHLARVFYESREQQSALALYANFHIEALKLAAQVRKKVKPKPADSKAVLLNEAYALHFLQDAFSSGHLQRLEGDSYRRMGTHDYYCQHGLATETWSDHEYLAHGDAFLGYNDLALASLAVAESLRQVSEALDPNKPALDLTGIATSGALDSCDASPATKRGHLVGAASNALLQKVLVLVPRSVLPGYLPTFVDEVGGFIMPLFDVTVRADFRDFQGTQADGTLGGWDRLPIRLSVGFGIGYTAQGITAGDTDGTLGVALVGTSDLRPPGTTFGSRFGLGVGWHLPFAYLPFDSVVFGACAAFGSDWCFRQVLIAASGGILDLQRVYSVGRWRVQFVALRGGALQFFGDPSVPDAPNTAEDEATTGNVFSFGGEPNYVQLRLPAFELARHRTAEEVALDAVYQLGYDLTYYNRDESAYGGPEEGDVFHGIFVSFGYRSRQYFR